MQGVGYWEESEQGKNGPSDTKIPHLTLAPEQQGSRKSETKKLGLISLIDMAVGN